MPEVKIKFQASVEQVKAMVAALENSIARRLLIERPIFMKDGNMANFELPMGKTAFLAIHTVDKAGDVVPAPVGDVFFASSADETMIVASVELSGPLQGAPELKMVSMALGDGIAVTISDSAGLQIDTILVDVVADLTPSAITVDEANAVFVPNA